MARKPKFQEELEDETQETEEDQTEEDQTDDSEDEEEDEDEDSSTQKTKEDERLERLAAERLKPMKKNMDQMAAKLKKAEAEAARLREQQEKAEEEDLKKRGKHTEVLQMKLEAEKEAKADLERQLDDLKRDQEVTRALSGIQNWRSERARELAEEDIRKQIVKDSEGQWVHESGLSLSNFMKDYVKDPDNELFFKPKTNSGAGGSKPSSAKAAEKPKKITEMTSEEAVDEMRKRLQASR